MPTITLFNPKGGSGKTTTALILATELAARGASVAMLDGDPNPNLCRWAERRGIPSLDAGKDHADDTEEALELMGERFGDARLVAVRCRDSVAVPDWLDALSRKYAFVIADPEGTANDWVNHAAAMSDLVIIPLRPGPMDAEQMLRAVKLVQAQSKALKREIAFRLLFTCSGHIMTRDEKKIREHAQAKGYPIMQTALAERAAFRAMVAQQRTLAELTSSGDDAVSGLDKARANALTLVAETVEAVGVRAAA
ncbi:MAG: ParA family protein [Rubrivivax sp.]|nr:ParA family protein [Rubrivivax sp.]